MHQRLCSTPLLIVTTVLLIVLAACWIPENFDTRVTVNKDGSYAFTYDGTLTYGSRWPPRNRAGSAPRTKPIFRKRGRSFGGNQASRRSITWERGGTRYCSKRPAAEANPSISSRVR